MNTKAARLGGAGVALLTLLASSLAVVAVAGTSADTAQALPSSELTRTPPPKVTGQKNRWGATIGGKSTGQGSRLNPKKSAKPKKPAAANVASGKKAPSRRNQDAPDERIPPLRLNTGICGLMEGDGTTPGPARCQPTAPAEPVVRTPGVSVTERLPRPEEVTWQQVLAESKNVLFRRLAVKVQPAGRTLVNLDTIVYTDESAVSTTQVTILGFPVDVEATPMSYLWSFGDGASLTTTTPGKPYPAKEITHKYLKRGSVSLRLTTNYAARFRVAGGAWQYIGTVPITGPATALQVREAVPVLVEPGG